MIRSSERLNIVENQALKFTRPEVNSFNCHNSNGVRLRLALIHLRDHKFKHSFQNCLNPILNCVIEVETTVNYLLHFPNYLPEIKSLLDNTKSVLPNILEQNKSFISHMLLFVDHCLDESSDIVVLSLKVNGIIPTKRFYDSIFTF